MGYGDQGVHEAARKDAELLESMLKQNSQLLHAPGFRGITPLHAAVEDNNLASVNILLKAGADVNALDENGEPPIFEASSRKVMDALKDAGAKFDIYSKRGHYGFQHCAAYVGSIEAMQFWLEQNIPLHHVPKFGWPAFIGAARHPDKDTQDFQPDIEILELLIKHGANINQQDRGGKTALINSCWEETVPIASFLLRAGADPTISDLSGTTALYLAVARNNKTLVQLLIDAGADPNQPNKFGDTPIDFAKEKNSCLNILEPLYKPGAKKPIPSPDAVLTRLKNIPSFQKTIFDGCTDEEIDKLEMHFKVTLPAAYRCFLKRLGKGAGDFMSSDSISFEYNALFKQAQSADYKNYCKLSKHAFVFAERMSDQFFFFEADGKSDDPPIFRFDDSGSGKKQIARSIWEFIEKLVIELEIREAEGRLD